MFLATVLICWTEMAVNCEPYTVSKQPFSTIEECYEAALGASMELIQQGIRSAPFCHQLEIGNLS